MSVPLRASLNEPHQSSATEALLPGACVLACVTLVPVVLRQLGALQHLPDPPLRLFDSDGITGSKQAHPLGVPDGVLGLCSYTVTLALAVAALRAERGPGHSRTAARLLGAKLLADGSVATVNTVRQVVTFRKLCSWCMGTVLTTAVMVYAGRRYVAGILHESS